MCVWCKEHCTHQSCCTLVVHCSTRHSRLYKQLYTLQYTFQINQVARYICTQYVSVHNCSTKHRTSLSWSTTMLYNVLDNVYRWRTNSTVKLYTRRPVYKSISWYSIALLFPKSVTITVSQFCSKTVSGCTTLVLQCYYIKQCDVTETRFLIWREISAWD